jgi:nucleoside-diphosphate kinase
LDVTVNIIHASDSVENAELELKRFFEPSELFSYEMSYTTEPKAKA